MDKYDIICAGEMLIDFTPGKESFSYIGNPGGAPANAAVAAARNGLRAAFLGKLGNDDFGRRLKQTLADNNVRLLCPELTNEAVTTLAFVTLAADGERSFTFARKPGADQLLNPEDISCSDIEDCSIFHAGSFSLSAEPSRSAIRHGMQLAHSLGKLVSFDINYRAMVWDSIEDCKAAVDELLPYIDFLKLSDEELFFVGGEENIPELMKHYDISVVIETLGQRGARYFFNGESRLLPASSVKAVDATGAGDAFWGAFLSRMLKFGIKVTDDISEEMVVEAVAYGNISGGLCVQSMGGIPAIPDAATIQRELEKV